MLTSLPSLVTGVQAFSSSCPLPRMPLPLPRESPLPLVSPLGALAAKSAYLW